MAVVAMAVPGSAVALETYVPTSSFGTVGSGDGQLELREHSGIAVNDATGDVYVADTGNHRIDEFDPSKPAAERFVRAFGADVGGVGVDVCATGCVAGTEGAVPGAFEEPRFIAVDNSGGAMQGDVYVGDSASRLVSKFDSEGNLIGSWGVDGQLDGSTATSPFAGPFGELSGIAVETAGNLDVASGSQILFRFAPGGEFLTDFETPRGNSPYGLAVDGNGQFFKINGEPTLTRFNSIGGESVQISKSLGRREQASSGLAVDQSNGDLFIGQENRVAKLSFSASGEVVGTGCVPTEGEGCPPTETLAEGSYPSGVSVAVNNSDHAVVVGNPAADSISVFHFARVPNVATLDVSDGGSVFAESAILPGTINAAGAGAATCEFEYTTESTFETEGFEGADTSPCEPAGPFQGTNSQTVVGRATGLTSELNYVYRIVGSNAEGSIPGEVQSFTAASAPTIVSGPTVTASGQGARISSQIRPNESLTKFSIQYTTAGAFSGSGFANALTAPEPPASLPLTSSVAVNTVAGQVRYGIKEFNPPDGQVLAGDVVRGPGIPPGTRIELVTLNELVLSKAPTRTAGIVPLVVVGPQLAVQQLSGLIPSTTYHYRLVATNSAGSTFSTEGVFATRSPPSSGLADGRVYELVSPAQKLGQVVPIEPKNQIGGTCPIQCLPGGNAQFVFPTQATFNGDAISYTGQPFQEGQAAGFNQYIARRGAQGWETEDLSASILGSGERQGFEASSEDLTRSVVDQIQPALSPEAPTRNGVPYPNLYLRTGHGFEPLIRQAPPHRSPGLPAKSPLNSFETVFAGGNAGTAAVPAFTHFVLEANDALTAEEPGVAPAAPEIAEGHSCSGQGGSCDIYESTGGQLRLVNVLPGNATTTPDAIVGSNVPSVRNPSPFDFDNAISADGSRIFWSEASTGQVYVRIDGTETRKIQDPGSFIDATPDGSKVLLSDGCIYDIAAGSCTDLTDGKAGFVGLMGSTASFSKVFFVDTAVIPGVTPNQFGKEAVEGEFNAYSYEGGTWNYIATLAPEDESFGNSFFNDWTPSSDNRAAQVTADGRFLAFMSRAPLTGYDNERAGGGVCGATNRCSEVFEYDSTAHRLFCPSCNPTGQQPLGQSNLSSVFAIPPNPGRPQPQNLPQAGGGRLFFESQDILAPEDANGHVQDVYEWEPGGIGNCAAGEGCLSLTSTGADPTDSFFMNATPTGSDVFIATRQRLVPADQNEQVDLYDAREGGGFPEVGPASCSGEACRSQAQSQPAASQIASNGPLPAEQTPKKPHKKKSHKKKHHKKKHHKKKHQTKNRPNTDRSGSVTSMNQKKNGGAR